jgi:hypothetical protein
MQSVLSTETTVAATPEMQVGAQQPLLVLRKEGNTPQAGARAAVEAQSSAAGQQAAKRRAPTQEQQYRAGWLPRVPALVRDVDALNADAVRKRLDLYGGVIRIVYGSSVARKRYDDKIDDTAWRRHDLPKGARHGRNHGRQHRRTILRRHPTARVRLHKPVHVHQPVLRERHHPKPAERHHAVLLVVLVDDQPARHTVRRPPCPAWSPTVPKWRPARFSDGAISAALH